MKILSVNVGKPQSYTLDGATLKTSMVKTPQSKIVINSEYIEGDLFQGPTIHGTHDSVVYALASQSYTYWSQFCGRTIPYGYLGENLSMETLDENDFYLGDEYQCGGVIIKVTGVRYPCNRLNYVTGNAKMRDEFLNQNWPGVYFEVVKSGTTHPHDELKLITRYQTNVNALDLYKGLRASEKKTISDETFTQLVDCPFLMQKYKDKLYRQSGRKKP